MCGIIGVKGKSNSSQLVLKGLKRMEYRGYDSWGIAMANRKLKVVKEVGKISDVAIRPFIIDGSQLAIGHTRWATHGLVTKENAHPHLSCNGEVAIVHNGIIENYQELKKELIEKGHKFRSATDSETIAHLIEENLNKGFPEAVRLAFSRLQGRNAMCAISASSHELVGARNGSPLIVGLNDTDAFIASDIPAFLENTRNIAYLDDLEMAVFDKSVKFFDVMTGKPVQKKIEHISWNIEQAKKGDYPHYMIKEILEQTQSIERAAKQDKRQLLGIAKEIRKAKGSFLVACGTSGYAAMEAQYFFSGIAGKHLNSVVGSEFSSFRHFLTPKSLIIAISQSGETADTLEAVDVARKMKSRVISIVNVMGSSLARQSDHFFLTNAGPEICVCSTKAFTSQLSVLLLLAHASAGKLSEGISLLQDTADQVKLMLNDGFLAKLRKLSASLAQKDDIYVIGRGLNYPIALEAALKIKEVSYIHAEGFAAGELKHGVIALVEKGTPCIAFVSNDEHRQATLSGAIEMKSRG